jgi:hypothetical protein
MAGASSGDGPLMMACSASTILGTCSDDRSYLISRKNVLVSKFPELCALSKGGYCGSHLADGVDKHQVELVAPRQPFS